MMHLRFITPLLLLLTAVSLPSHAADTTGARAGTDCGGKPCVQNPHSGLREEVQVVLRSLDILVVDKHGKPVSDLRKEEVHLWEDREPQTITHFTRARERSSGAEFASHASPDQTRTNPAPAQDQVASAAQQGESPRWIIFFFDANSSSLQSRIRAADAAREMATSGLHPEDRVSVIVGDEELRIVVPFTRDHALVARTIQDGAGLTNRSRDLTAMLDSARSDAESCRDEDARQYCVSKALQNFLTETSLQARRSLRQLESLVRGLSVIPDRKVVFWFSDGPIFNPGDVASAIAQYAIGTVGTRIPVLVTSLHRDFSGETERIVQLASRGRVGFYPVNCLGRASDTWMAAENRSDGGPEQTPQAVTEPYELAGKMARDVQTRLALATGGSTLFKREIAGLLPALLDTSEGVYSLGYDPTGGSGKLANIKVTVDRKGLKVLYLHQRRPLSIEATRRLGGDLTVQVDSYDSLAQIVRAELNLPVTFFAIDPGVTPPASGVGLFIEVTDASGTLLQDKFEVLSLPRVTGRVAPIDAATRFRRPFALSVPAGTYQVRAELQDLNGPDWGSFSTWFTVSDKNARANAASPALGAQEIVPPIAVDSPTGPR